MTVFDFILSFILFMVVQSLIINGLHYSFSGKMVKYMDEIKPEGAILYKVRLFVSKYVSDYWQNPLFGCVRCMASFWGTITYWGTVLPVFGFSWFEVWVWILDILALVSLNFFVYKQL